MADPLGIADLYTPFSGPAWQMLYGEPDHWYWCRRHEQAEHASEPSTSPCNCSGTDAPGHDHRATCASRPWNRQECVRIGPFMSEAEANRLTGNQPAGYGAWPLGMEVK